MSQSLLARKKELLQKFEELTQKQLELLAQEEYEQLEDLFAEKDRIIREVEGLDLKLSDQERNQEELKALARKIYDSNILLEKKLQEAKQALGEMIIHLQQVKKQEHLYRSQPSQMEGVFIDKRS